MKITKHAIEGADVPGHPTSWSDISKTGSSLADLATRSAGDLSSGNLGIDRMPTGGTWTLSSGLTLGGNQDLTLTGDLITSGTVDGVDVSDLKDDVDGFPDELKNLVQVEIEQLENIGSVTISAGQWGYLSALDQALDQAQSVQFAGLTLTGNHVLNDGINIEGQTTTGTKIGTASDQKFGFWNVNPIVQPSHFADASASHSITDPADTPVDADALRDDLVANAIPDIESALDSLGSTINSIVSVLETTGLMANA